MTYDMKEKEILIGGGRMPRIEARVEGRRWGMDKQNTMTYMYEIIIEVP